MKRQVHTLIILMVTSLLVLQAVSNMKAFLRAKYPGDSEGISVGFHTPSGERLYATFSCDVPVKVCKTTLFAAVVNTF